MKNKRHVREFMFFQLLGMIPVFLAFDGEFLYAIVGLIIAFLFYKFDPVIKDFCENVEGLRKIFWLIVVLGLIFAGITHILSWGKSVLGLLWVIIFFVTGIFHAGKVQSFLDERRH